MDEYGELTISSEFVSTYHNMNIIVQTTGGGESLLNGKIEILNKTLDNITRAPIVNSEKKNLADLPVSMPYGSTTEPRICFVVMLLTSSGIYQDHHTNTSKYVA